MTKSPQDVCEGGYRGRCSNTTLMSLIKVDNTKVTGEEENAENLKTYFNEVGKNLTYNFGETDETFLEYIVHLFRANLNFLQ